MSIAAPDERTEAVIISGPRRGQIVTLPINELTADMEVEALLDAMVSSAQRMAETARSMAEETRELVGDIRAARMPQ
jgi:hypothetical protein